MNAKGLTLFLAIVMLLGVLTACATPDTEEQNSDTNQESVTGDV